MQNPNFVQLLQNPKSKRPRLDKKNESIQNQKSKRPRLDFGSWTAGTGHVTNEDVWPGTRISRSW